MIQYSLLDGNGILVSEVEDDTKQRTFAVCSQHYKITDSTNKPLDQTSSDSKKKEKKNQIEGLNLKTVMFGMTDLVKLVRVTGPPCPPSPSLQFLACRIFPAAFLVMSIYSYIRERAAGAKNRSGVKEGGQ